METLRTATMENVKALHKFVTAHADGNSPIYPPITSEERFNLKNAIYDFLGDFLIPVELFPYVYTYSIACYDKEGFGFIGIDKEIKERLTYAKRNNISLSLIDFFKHPNYMTDLVWGDKNIEKKTGCGQWFDCKYNSLDKARQELEKSGEFIKWDYTYKAKKEGEFNFSIHIFTTWTYFFRYLDTYDKGYKSFFKLNKTKSVTAGTNIFDMNTLKTSKKKVRFLRAFVELEGERD